MKEKYQLILGIVILIIWVIVGGFLIFKEIKQ